MKLDKDGKTLIIYNKDDIQGYLLIYQRASIANEFTLIEVEQTDPVSTDNLALQMTDKLITINYGTGNRIKIFYCGASIVTSTALVNGKDAIMAATPASPAIIVSPSNLTTIIQSPTNNSQKMSAR